MGSTKRAQLIFPRPCSDTNFLFRPQALHTLQVGEDAQLGAGLEQDPPPLALEAQQLGRSLTVHERNENPLVFRASSIFSSAFGPIPWSDARSVRVQLDS